MFAGHILSALLNADGWTLFTSGLASGLEWANDALKDDLDPIKKAKELGKQLWENYKDELVPDPDLMEKVYEKIQELKEEAEKEGEVFKNIAENVYQALSSGQTPDEGDAGLGQTHDNFTPGGDQYPVGQTPGIDIGGVGLNRTGDGGSDGGVGYGGDSGSGSSGGSTTPLGVTGSGAGTGSGEGSSGGGGSSSATGVAPPTASDLGLDPNSGAYIEYQPSEGQVQITYPDGTTETRPWPPV